MSPPERVAVVTGATSGIGAAVTARLAARGDRVVGVGRDPARAASLETGAGVEVVRGDLTDPAVVAEVARTAGPRVGLLVHAAGVGAARPLEDTPDALLDAVLATDLAAPIRLSRALLPALRAATPPGRVAVVASIAVVGVAGETVYSAAKAGLRGFADAWRLESGLVVTTVLPGIVDTPFTAARGGAPRRVPRPVSAERVAAALLDGVARGRVEVSVPRWLAIPARLHGMAPGAFARLSARFA